MSLLRYSKNTIRTYENCFSEFINYWNTKELISIDQSDIHLSKVKNLKHRCLLMTCYSGGLRISEVLNLKPADIDSSSMLIQVKGGKGNKDRVTLLSVKLLTMLREYYKKYKPEEYLFTGQMGGKYSSRSAQKVLKEASRSRYKE